MLGLEMEFLPRYCVLHSHLFVVSSVKNHFVDPLTPKIFSISQIDELFRGLSLAPAHAPRIAVTVLSPFEKSALFPVIRYLMRLINPLLHARGHAT